MGRIHVMALRGRDTDMLAAAGGVSDFAPPYDCTPGILSQHLSEMDDLAFRIGFARALDQFRAVPQDAPLVAPPAVAE